MIMRFVFDEALRNTPMLLKGLISFHANLDFDPVFNQIIHNSRICEGRYISEFINVSSGNLLE